MFGLYLLGALTALGSAALLKSTLVRGNIATFYMELPPYRFPTLKLLSTQVWQSAASLSEARRHDHLRRLGRRLDASQFPARRRRPRRTSAEAQAQQQLEVSAAGAHRPCPRARDRDRSASTGRSASGSSRASRLARSSSPRSRRSTPSATPTTSTDCGKRSKATSIPATGRRPFDLPVALSLLVFFVFALQCTSTIVVMARETGSWRWPAFAFSYMLALAYGASFITYHLARAWLV